MFIFLMMKNVVTNPPKKRLNEPECPLCAAPLPLEWWIKDDEHPLVKEGLTVCSCPPRYGSDEEDEEECEVCEDDSKNIKKLKKLKKKKVEGRECLRECLKASWFFFGWRFLYCNVVSGVFVVH